MGLFVGKSLSRLSESLRLKGDDGHPSSYLFTRSTNQENIMNTQRLNQLVLALSFVVPLFVVSCATARSNPHAAEQHEAAPATTQSSPVTNQNLQSPALSKDQAAHIAQHTAMHIAFASGHAYATLAFLHSPRRNLYYQTLDGKTKGNVWFLHFTTFELDRGKNLTAEQAEFVNTLKAAVTGADLDADKSIVDAIYSERNRAVMLFGKQDGQRLIADFAKPLPKSALTPTSTPAPRVTSAPTKQPPAKKSSR
jgi:hypothetical protein